ncbi:MAG: 1-acyl-sn-glycerol-3-phosphate acyltransferase [Treponema sp.]|nr:1-acyl-sn-glycerol-3-phosphate acyltransferase [Treponema sp.]
MSEEKEKQGAADCPQKEKVNGGQAGGHSQNAADQAAGPVDSQLAGQGQNVAGQSQNVAGRELTGKAQTSCAAEIQKDPGRLAVLERIKEYEKKGWWTKDVEEDPPTIPLTPDKVDYLNKKLSNKILTWFVNIGARRFIKNLVKDGKMIIKEIRGIENFEDVEEQGVVITCNHFNPFDNFAIHYALFPYMYNRSGRVLYKVIREGNYTNFPGIYGLFFRHCNTLPLSANFSTMKKFMEAVKVLLNRGEKILVYAEQGMWWNYRKPRPLTVGAFKFAAENRVPVLPMFITMTDSDRIGADGFPLQEYTLHIMPAIYPDPEASVKQNMTLLRDKNYAVWKDCYEKFYGIPLVYETEESSISGAEKETSAEGASSSAANMSSKAAGGSFTSGGQASLSDGVFAAVKSSANSGNSSSKTEAASSSAANMSSGSADGTSSSVESSSKEV